MTQTVCIIQARMGSTRLPGKVAMDICGKSMLERVAERARYVEGIDKVVVATSNLPDDDRVEHLATRADVPCFRGSELDVLERYHQAAIAYRAEEIVRVTADCPLLDYNVSGLVVTRFRKEQPDYASNTLTRTYPRGLDTELLRMDVLDVAHREATEQLDREHVTRFIWTQPKRFTLCSILGATDHSDLRWTVDTHEDLELVNHIYNELGKSIFAMHEVISLLKDHPQWRTINAHIKQKILQ